MNLVARHHRLSFPRRPLVMGIVNLNDDSFCDDGTLDPDQAWKQAEQQLRDGADIIDIGAESARTNREAVSVEEEVRRLTAFLTKWEGWVASLHGPLWDEEQVWPPLLSINSWRTEVIEATLHMGADILNDISALPTAANAEVCARHGVALLIMHSIGQPKVPHVHVRYPDVMESLDTFFEEKIQLALQAGLTQEHLILDPGIDFAKQSEDNLTIYREMERMHRFGCPFLLPVSRKTVIGDVLQLRDPLQRDAGTVACIAAGMKRGAQIFRVHNVAATAQVVKVLWGVEGKSLPA